MLYYVSSLGPYKSVPDELFRRWRQNKWRCHVRCVSLWQHRDVDHVNITLLIIGCGQAHAKFLGSLWNRKTRLFNAIVAITSVTTPQSYFEFGFWHIINKIHIMLCVGLLQDPKNFAWVSFITHPLFTKRVHKMRN